MSQNKINIRNKRAYYEFEIMEKFVAGLILTGTEIKSIRQGKASIKEAHCVFMNQELWVKNMQITEYELGTHYNHEPKRDRKLLLSKRELKRLLGKVKEKGLTITTLHLFISERGFAKLEIALGRGKKIHDKRQSIKEKDEKRSLERRDTYRN